MTKFFLVLMSNVTKFILVLMAICFARGDLGSSMFKFTNNETEQKVKDQMFIVFQLFLAFQEWASEVVLVIKNLPASAGKPKRRRFDPWVGKIPWRRAQQPTPIILLGESHGQRSLMGYSPQVCKKLDTTEAT